MGIEERSLQVAKVIRAVALVAVFFSDCLCKCSEPVVRHAGMSGYCEMYARIWMRWRTRRRNSVRGRWVAVSR
jgi:hypothetical protein